MTNHYPAYKRKILHQHDYTWQGVHSLMELATLISFCYSDTTDVYTFVNVRGLNFNNFWAFVENNIKCIKCSKHKGFSQWEQWMKKNSSVRVLFLQIRWDVVNITDLMCSFHSLSHCKASCTELLHYFTITTQKLLNFSLRTLGYVCTLVVSLFPNVRVESFQMFPNFQSI